jgi:hypothetical protein
MKMDSYVLKRLNLRSEKHNEYIENALHTQSIIVSSDGML